ncbi:MAG TPA: cation:proton antiporter [Longimicrobiales bacterium]|nr:cation:proton antiporter [Longimicrobiales bacterium]
MRRIITLALLFGGMRLILPLGSQGQGSQALLSFGFLILAAYTVGEIASAVRLPKVVGYLLAGILFGPHILAALTPEGIGRLAPVSDLAVALIAFLAGAELRWDELRERGAMLTKVVIAELATAFVAITTAVYALHGLIPGLRGLVPVEVLAMAMLFASVAVVHSPAVTMALLSETGARGPVARNTLGVVLLTDVAVVLLFSAVLSLARIVAPPPGAGVGPTLGAVIWEIAGALVIGAALGAAVAGYVRWVGRELVFFAVLVAFFGVELVRLAHVELLLTLLTAGFVTENLAEQGEALRSAMARSAAPIFVVFFALSGAKIDVAQVLPLLPLVLPIAVVRATAIWGGVRLGLRWAGGDVEGGERVWMGLVSQAGVAIGLATILAGAYPVRGTALAGLLLALIALNETVGPILFRRALSASGEAVAEPPDEPEATLARSRSA